MGNPPVYCDLLTLTVRLHRNNASSDGAVSLFIWHCEALDAPAAKSVNAATMSFPQTQEKFKLLLLLRTMQNSLRLAKNSQCMARLTAMEFEGSAA